MTSPGHVRTAAARRARTRAKHLRWAAELAVAGWWVVEAGPITVAAFDLDGGAGFGLYCAGCNSGPPFAEWDEPRPLPAVLAKVNGHVCTPEEKS